MKHILSGGNYFYYNKHALGAYNLFKHLELMPAGRVYPLVTRGLWRSLSNHYL